MSVFGGRSPPVHRHRQQTSLIIVRAQLQMKYKQMLLQFKKSSSSIEFFSWKNHYKLLEDGPLSIQSRLLKNAKNEMNTLRFFISDAPQFQNTLYIYTVYTIITLRYCPV